MTSLPAKVPERLRNRAHIVSAYDICLRLEKSLQQATDKGEDVGKSMINIRILGYLIHFVPTDQGLKTVVDEITSCKDDFALLNVGKMYYDHYIRACMFATSTYLTCHLTRSLSQSQQRPHTNTLQSCISTLV
jgi:hypothetical protein